MFAQGERGCIDQFSLLKFAEEFQVTPAWCTPDQLLAVFMSTNASEAYVSALL